MWWLAVLLFWGLIVFILIDYHCAISQTMQSIVDLSGQLKRLQHDMSLLDNKMDEYYKRHIADFILVNDKIPPIEKDIRDITNDLLDMYVALYEQNK